MELPEVGSQAYNARKASAKKIWEKRLVCKEPGNINAAIEKDIAKHLSKFRVSQVSVKGPSKRRGLYE